jgi:hypothetical protein
VKGSFQHHRRVVITYHHPSSSTFIVFLSHNQAWLLACSFIHCFRDRSCNHQFHLVHPLLPPVIPTSHPRGEVSYDLPSLRASRSTAHAVHFLRAPYRTQCHIVGWNLSFPSSIEQLLWRISTTRTNRSSHSPGPISPLRSKSRPCA